jgi:uncharacterized protein (TIGR02186 family)
MIRAIFILLLIMCCSYPAQASLDVDISEPDLKISTGFNGDALTLFGTANPKGDIILLLKGPEKETVIRRKSDVFGLWIQSKSVVFSDVPGYYNVASSKPVKDIAAPETLRELRLGINNLSFEADENTDIVPTFQEALIQNKQLKRLFSLTPDAVDYINDTLFKTRIYMPANVPLGDYTIEAFLFKDGQLIDRESKPFTVSQTGLTGDLSAFSKDSPFLYGVSIVFLAFLSGISASLLLRRD